MSNPNEGPMGHNPLSPMGDESTTLDYLDPGNEIQRLKAIEAAAFDLDAYEDFADEDLCQACTPEGADAYRLSRLRLHNALYPDDAMVTLRIAELEKGGEARMVELGGCDRRPGEYASGPLVDQQEMEHVTVPASWLVAAGWATSTANSSRRPAWRTWSVTATW